MSVMTENGSGRLPAVWPGFAVLAALGIVMLWLNVRMIARYD
jgi:hypothetical protein